MKKLCIIPARGGSKRLPRKNIKLLNGKPLVFYTINAVLKSNIFDKVIFTSDNQEILDKVSINYNSPYLKIIKRPKKLATDTSKVIDTVLHFLDDSFDQIWLALPTCPLRISDDFINANQLLTKNIDSVVSYTEMEHPPTLGLIVKNDGIIEDYDKSMPWQNGNSRSQDHATVYRPNGALYGSWTEKLKRNKNFYVGKIKGHFMPRERSIDIDTELDFKIIEVLLNNK